MFSRKVFYDVVRHLLFDGRLNSKQVEGMEKILDFWIKWYPIEDLRYLCYALATTYWETAKTMQPISEYGGQSYLKRKKYWPYYGRGLVQLTWLENYRVMQKILKEFYNIDVDIVKFPDKAMEWEVALPVMFEGMTKGQSLRGDFTGKSLEDYFSLRMNDPRNARRIINGTDRAAEIHAVHDKFSAAFLASLTLE